MAKRISVLIFYIVAACASLSFSGCSAIGYGIGVAFEGAPSSKPVLVPGGLAEIPLNARVVVQKNDSSTVQGDFSGLAQIADTIMIEPAKYTEEFERWRLSRVSDTAWIPPLGTSIQVKVRVPAGKDLYTGRIVGVDARSLKISSDPTGTVIPLKMEFVQHVCDSLGRVITTHDNILRILGDGAPQSSRVELKPSIVLDGSDITVPINEVHSVSILEHGWGRWLGLGIGAALDVAFIAAMAGGLPDMQFGS